MSSLDLKSLIIGILSCVLVFMLMGLSIGSNGRYQVFCGDSVSACALLNVETGVTKLLKLRPSNSDKLKGFIGYGEEPDF